MGPFRQRSPWRGTPAATLVVLFLAHVAASAAVMTAFSQIFNYGDRVVILHLLVIVSLFSVVALLAGALLTHFRSTLTERVISWAAAAWIVILAALYGANLLSTSSWGYNVTMDLAARYVTRPWVLVGYVSAVTSWGWLIGIALLAVVFGIWLARSGLVVFAVGTLIDARGPFEPRTVRRTVASLGGVSLVLATLIVWMCPPPLVPELLAREPLVGFFRDEVSFHRFALTRIAGELRRDGPVARATYPRVAAFDRRNVILIVPDSMRADHLGLYGYARETSPFLDRMTRNGELRHVKLALSTCPASDCGISSLLTSKTFGSLIPENFGLHELLHDQGYAVNFILSGDHRMLGLPEVYGDAVTFLFDGLMSRRYEPTDDRVILEALEQLPDFSGTPTFFFFHLMSSHVAGVRQDRARVFRPDRNLAGLTSFDGVERETHVNSYDNGIRQADAILEQLWDVLGRKGFLANALVVIVADHGEGLGEHGVKGHAFQGLLYQEFLRVPMLIRDDPDVVYANLERATHTDVAPTIVQRLGLPVPAAWEGQSLVNSPARPFTHHFMDTFEMPLYAVVHQAGDRLYKYIRQQGREELFDLTSDPGERQQGLAAAPPAVVHALRRYLDGLLTSLD